MLIDNGQSLVPYWLVAAAGRPADEVRLDSGTRVRRSCTAADGIRSAPRRPGRGRRRAPRSSIRRSACCSATTPTSTTSTRASRRTTGGSPSSARTRPTRLIGLGQTALRTPRRRHPRPRGDQAPRSARRDAARHPAERRLRRPDVRRVLGRGRRPRAAAVVPHPDQPVPTRRSRRTSAARS